MAPSRAESGGGLGARAAVEHYFGGTTLVGADGVGRLQLSPRIELEIAGALRFGPSVAAPHGQVSALGRGRRRGAAGAGRGRPARVARRGRGRLGGLARVPRRAGAGRGGSRVREPARGRRACGCSAGWRSGVRCTRTAGLDGGVALRGVEATDAGEVVASARGVDAGRDARTGGAVSRVARRASRRLALVARGGRLHAQRRGAAAPPTAAAPWCCS